MIAIPINTELTQSFWGAMSFGATPESNYDSGRVRTSLARMTL